MGVTLAEAALATFAFNVEDERSTGCGAYLTLLTLNQQRSQQNSPLSRLIYTINSLKDLVILHRKFKIKLKLAEFMDPIKTNVVSWILDWTTSPHEIAPLLSSFLLDYMHRWDLDQDATLAEYVTGILRLILFCSKQQTLQRLDMTDDDQVYDGDAWQHRLHLALAHWCSTLGGESFRAAPIHFQC